MRLHTKKNFFIWDIMKAKKYQDSLGIYQCAITICKVKYFRDGIIVSNPRTGWRAKGITKIRSNYITFYGLVLRSEKMHTGEYTDGE